MKEILKFKNMQEMSNEADEFLTKIGDMEIKVCAKFLLISCYSYLNEFITDDSKKTYKNIATLICYELLETEYEDGEHSKLYTMLQNANDKSTAKKVYKLYFNCEKNTKKYAQMRLMELLLTYYIK